MQFRKQLQLLANSPWRLVQCPIYMAQSKVLLSCRHGVLSCFTTSIWAKSSLRNWVHHQLLHILFFWLIIKNDLASLMQERVVRRNFNPVYNPVMDKHPIQGGVEILLLASCHGNWDKLRPDGIPGLNTDVTFCWPSAWKILICMYKVLCGRLSSFFTSVERWI